MLCDSFRSNGTAKTKLATLASLDCEQFAKIFSRTQMKKEELMSLQQSDMTEIQSLSGSVSAKLQSPLNYEKYNNLYSCIIHTMNYLNTHTHYISNV